MKNKINLLLVFLFITIIFITAITQNQIFAQNIDKTLPKEVIEEMKLQKTKTPMYNSYGACDVLGGDSGGSVYMYDGCKYKIHGVVSSSSKDYPNILYSSPIYWAEYAGFNAKTN